MGCRKTYEVVGYAYDGDVYCLDCLGDPETVEDNGYGPNPVFLGDLQGDECCGECRELLEEV